MKKSIIFNQYLDEELLFEATNKNIKIIEKELNTKIVITNDALIVEENVEEMIIHILEIMSIVLKNKETIKPRLIESIILMIKSYPLEQVKEFFSKTYTFSSTYDGRTINAKTINQKIYFDELNKKDIVIAFGSAGAGKTYLAVAYCLNMLKKNKIKKII